MLIPALCEYADKNLGVRRTEVLKMGYRLVLSPKAGVKPRLEKEDLDHVVPRRFKGVLKGNAVSNYLYEVPNYVLGHGKRSEGRFNAFWDTVKDVVSRSGDTQALKAVENALADTSWIQDILQGVEDDKEFAGAYIALAIEGEGQILCNRELVHKRLEDDFQELTNGGDAVLSYTYSWIFSGEKFPLQWGNCRVTGQDVPVVRLHFPIEGVAGTTRGCPLVSFNDATACYRGRVRGGNFPVGYLSMLRYTEALNHIIANQSFKRSEKVGENEVGITMAFWGGPNDDFSRAVSLFLGRLIWHDKKEHATLWKWIWEVIENTQDFQVNVLVLRGSQARIAVQSFTSMRSKELAQELVRIRDHFKEAYPDDKPFTLADLMRDVDGILPPGAPHVVDVGTMFHTFEALIHREILPPSFSRAVLYSLPQTQRIPSDPKKATLIRRAHTLKALWLTFQHEQMKGIAA